jgi:hypothetical protein
MAETTKEAVLDPEKLKDQGNLTEDQAEAVAQEAMKEYETENPPNQDEDPEHTKNKEEQAGQQTEEEKAQAEADRKAAEEANKTDEQKAQEKEAADKLKTEEDTKKKEAFEQEVQAYAKESNLSVEEARTELESVGKIVDKYKGDAKQLAKANLHMQRTYSKTAEELKALKEAKPSVPEKEITIDTVIKAIDEGKITLNGKTAMREEVISAYREQYPDVTETIDDEAVLKLASKEMIDGIKKHRESFAKETESKAKEQAKEKKQKLIADLSAADKQFLPEIEPILNRISDSAILNEHFSVTDMVLWAKGKKFDQAIKEAEERGFKRGKEDPTIVGSKPQEGSQITKKAGGKKTRTLTADEKERALDMYESAADLSDEQKFEMFVDYLDSGKK